MAIESPEQTTDRRILRTHRALRDALLSLLSERCWDDLSVQDICERADVGRSTFYAHFQSKEALLAYGLNDLRSWLVEQTRRAGRTGGGSLMFARGLIDHAAEQRKVFASIIGRRSGQLVQQRFRDMVIELINDDLGPPRSGWQREAHVRTLAGALVELLAWWIDSQVPCSPAELEQHFLQSAQPMIAAFQA